MILFINMLMTPIFLLRKLTIYFDHLLYPPGSLDTISLDTIVNMCLRGMKAQNSLGPNDFKQLIHTATGRNLFLEMYAHAFNHNRGKKFDTTPVINAMHAVKINQKDGEFFDFQRYYGVKDIDDLITYLEFVRDSPDILILEM